MPFGYKALEPGVKPQVVDMAINGSGIRDTARVLKISKNTVIRTLKKAGILVRVNPNFLPGTGREMEVRLEMACPEAEMDEQWPYVGDKSNQRWLWYAVDHATNTILAYVFGKRKDMVFEELKALLEPFGIRRFYLCPAGIRTAGARTNATSPRKATRRANATPRKSNEKT